jgi:hypothetical protein
MSNREPKAAETNPSRDETTSLGQRSVALLGERGKSEVLGVFDDPIYGGLETHVAFFAPEEGKIVRVGTMQDEEGNDPRPDFHVVIMELSEASYAAPIKETTYDFTSGALGYGVEIGEELVTYNEEGLKTGSTALAGRIALKALKKIPKSEREVLKKAVAAVFDRTRYNELSRLISLCGPHNRMGVHSGEDEVR